MSESARQKPLRLWPGVVAVVLQWLGIFVISNVVPEFGVMGFVGAALSTVAFVLWWMAFSRVPHSERWGAVVLVIAAMVAASRLLHESVAWGNMGAQYFIYAIPVLSLALVVWAAMSHRLSDGARRATMGVAILFATGFWTLLRSDGLSGDGGAEFAWRWSQTSEQRLLAQTPDRIVSPDELKTPPSIPIAEETSEERHVGEAAPSSRLPSGSTPDMTADVVDKPTARLTAAVPEDIVETEKQVEKRAHWPGFRGPNRDGVIPGVRIGTDWSSSPPLELWRRPIGPGVSSFAVSGELLYTQEQRGEEEIVSCHNVRTGDPVWRHSDATRFWDAHVGAGPRATPALGGARVYSLGATGILNALDAGDGSVLWSRNAAADTEAKLPYFGFVSSPLVIDNDVIVHTGRLVAYDLATGDPRWFGPAKGGSHSSPHLLTLDGVQQVLSLSGDVVISVAPKDGSLLWEHPWPRMMGIVQPALTAEGDVLISMSDDASAAPVGTRRIAVAHQPGGWTVEERWTSIRLKPSFSPIVVHQGHAYGFDGRILACIDVADGKRKWKGGRYGSGQLLLLPDQDLLLVVSEQGELALVEAKPDQFTELARFSAIEGKTWNQPVLIGDLLLVRNGEEMAAFRLAPPSGG